MDDVLLCVSELTTNALAHGGPPDRGFVLRVTATADGLVHIEVHDAGEGQPRLGEWSDDQEHGRGLWLVESLADKWGVTHCHPGKVVWAEFRVKAAPQGPGRCA